MSGSLDCTHGQASASSETRDAVAAPGLSWQNDGISADTWQSWAIRVVAAGTPAAAAVAAALSALPRLDLPRRRRRWIAGMGGAAGAGVWECWRRLSDGISRLTGQDNLVSGASFKTIAASSEISRFTDKSPASCFCSSVATCPDGVGIRLDGLYPNFADQQEVLLVALRIVPVSGEAAVDVVMAWLHLTDETKQQQEYLQASTPALAALGQEFIRENNKHYRWDFIATPLAMKCKYTAS